MVLSACIKFTFVWTASLRGYPNRRKKSDIKLMGSAQVGLTLASHHLAGQTPLL